jgi:hypothetical protein
MPRILLLALVIITAGALVGVLASGVVPSGSSTLVDIVLELEASS